MIVDSHLHVWSADLERYPVAEGREPREAAPVELLNENMAAAGVDQAVIVQAVGYMHDNRYVADCLRRFPGRFAGTALIDQKAPDAADVLEKLVREDGFIGLRIHLASRVDHPSLWATPDQDPLWRKAEEIGANFTLYGPAAHLEVVEPIVARFPGVKVVLDHVGGVPRPDEDDHDRLLEYVVGFARHEHVHVKFTPQRHRSQEPFPHRDTFDLYRRLFDAYGPRRVMWGTNFPGVLGSTGYAPALELFQRHLDFLTDEDRRWLLGETAREVFGLR